MRKNWKITRVAIEWKLQDLWVGVFWRHGYAAFDDGAKRMFTDVWICVLPCIPLHITLIYSTPILFCRSEEGK